MTTRMVLAGLVIGLGVARSTASTPFFFRPIRLG